MNPIDAHNAVAALTAMYGGIVADLAQQLSRVDKVNESLMVVSKRCARAEKDLSTIRLCLAQDASPTSILHGIETVFELIDKNGYGGDTPAGDRQDQARASSPLGERKEPLIP